MKFPSELVTQLGILLLLGVELYFFVHLYQFRSRFVSDDSGWEVAWIGVYNSGPARMLMVMSILVLPNAAAALLGRRALLSAGGTPIGWVQQIAFILVSGASTAAIWILLPIKRSAVPPGCDVAPDEPLVPSGNHLQNGGKLEVEQAMTGHESGAHDGPS